MPNERQGYRRIEIEVPAELLAAIEAAAGPGRRNAWVARVLARAAKVPLPAERLAPRRGRPRKPDSPAA